MKVLILANNDVGLYKFRKELIHSILEKGHEVYISLPYGELVDKLVDMGCKFIDTPVDRRGINPATDMKLIKEYKQILKDVKPDMTVTYTIKPNIYGGMMCRRLNIPYCVNITGLGTAFQNDNWLKKLVVALYKYSLKKVKTVFFENAENRDIFVRNNIILKNKTHCLNGAGVNLEEYSFKEYPHDDKECRFLFIGRVMKEKGVDELFEAAKKIKAEHSNVFFDIVGPMEDNYKDILERYENEGIIKYYGSQADVKPFIERASCFVLPSYHEGMANTLLECGAMGRPLITSNIHGCLEAVEDGKTGYLCKVKDADDLYVKMKKFIELPYADKVKMGQASHELVAGKFDKRKVVEETVREIMR